MHAYKGHRLAKNRSRTRQILVEAEQVAKKQHNELYIQRIAVCRKVCGLFWLAFFLFAAL